MTFAKVSIGCAFRSTKKLTEMARKSSRFLSDQFFSAWGYILVVRLQPSQREVQARCEGTYAVTMLVFELLKPSWQAPQRASFNADLSP